MIWPCALACLAALPVDFQLPDDRGQLIRLRDRREPVVVVAFLGTACPVSQQYALRLNDIARDFDSRGVAVIGVDPNPGDCAADLARFKQDRGLSYSLVRDVNQTLVRRLGATRQPEVFVLDAARVVRYRGRVDDQFAPGRHRGKPGRQDLVIALDELLAGGPVSVQRTEPAGCPIERLPTAADSGVTYSRDVAPILNRRCVACHRPGGIGPFSLRTAEDSERWAGAIREAVTDRRMPPWHADPKYGHFSNDPSLTDAERRLIDEWAAGGAARGEPVEPAPLPTEGWTMRTPDVVVPMPAPFGVPASGDVPYQLFEVDPGFKEDVWVQEAEILPGNRAVVHHATVFIRPPGIDSLVTQGELGSFCLCAYATGTPPMLLPAGMAKKLPAGWRLVFVMHYVPNGSTQTDQTRIGLKLLPTNQVRQEVATNILLSEELKIPPRCAQYIETRSRQFDKDVLLLALFPHMHLRGVSFRYEVTYPDGRTEVLLSVPKWDMAWQHRYVLAEPKRLPAGSVLTATGVYDNSAANPNNPDPDAEVRAGPQTTDEMFNGYYDFCLADQDLTRPNWRPWAWGGVAALVGLVALWRWRK
ncbi:MAG: redoxin domain-containing protein, partial [Gemmataceae bacterium]